MQVFLRTYVFMSLAIDLGVLIFLERGTASCLGSRSLDMRVELGLSCMERRLESHLIVIFRSLLWGEQILQKALWCPTGPNLSDSILTISWEDMVGFFQHSVCQYSFGHLIFYNRPSFLTVPDIPQFETLWFMLTKHRVGEGEVSAVQCGE